MRLAPLLAQTLIGGCCLPVTETLRPPLSGRVLDGGQPLAQASIEACTFSGWFPPECEQPVRTTTDADGRFSLPPQTRFPLIIHGEAPFMTTVLTACHEGRLAAALLGSAPAPVQLDLVLGEPLVKTDDHLRTEPSEAFAFAQSRCPR